MEFAGNETTAEVDIPGTKVGAVIGRGGATIRDMQDRFSVKMQMDQDSSMGRKVLRISGAFENVESAKQAVHEIVNSTPDQAAPQQMYQGAESVLEVVVPRSAAGIIIGRGGETIKRLQAETGTYIKFAADEDPNSEGRLVIVKGPEPAVRDASIRLSELVVRSGQPSQTSPQSQLFHITVPADKAGLIIGRGGESIKQIQAETGARVGMSREPTSNPDERVMEIRGTPEQYEMVRHIIGIKIGEVAPGTPMGMGMQRPAPQQQQMHHAAAPMGYDQQTGQADYSVQWAQYYRSVGMHKEAEEIEQKLMQRERRGPTHYGN